MPTLEAMPALMFLILLLYGLSVGLPDMFNQTGPSPQTESTESADFEDVLYVLLFLPIF